MNPKIAFVSNTSWSIYNFRLSLMKFLSSSGFEVVAIAPLDKYSEKIKSEGFEFFDITFSNHGKNMFKDAGSIINFFKVFKHVRPNVVCQFTIKPNIYGSIVARFLNIKTVVNIAGLGTIFMSDNTTTKIVNLMYKKSLQKVDKVFFQNKEDFDLFINNNIVNKNKCDILPGSGVDIEKFRPIEKQTNNKITKFIHISRIIWSKGIKEYVKAAEITKKKYPQTEFLLLGSFDIQNPDGISIEEVKSWEKEGYINYLGTTDDVKNVLSKIDCVVLASFYREGTPKVLLESASMGKPIITTNNVGCKDVVQDGFNGFICDKRNAKDLAEKIELFLELNQEERIRLGANGRAKIIKEFNEKIIFNKYLDVITNLTV